MIDRALEIMILVCLLGIAASFVGQAMQEKKRPQPIDPGLCHIAGGQVIHTARGTLCSKGTT